MTNSGEGCSSIGTLYRCGRDSSFFVQGEACPNCLAETGHIDTQVLRCDCCHPVSFTHDVGEFICGHCLATHKGASHG